MLQNLCAFENDKGKIESIDENRIDLIGIKELEINLRAKQRWI
jgi:hypothetical protein